MKLLNTKSIIRYLPPKGTDRKSTRLNSSHLVILYAVFCLKKNTLSGRMSALATQAVEGTLGSADMGDASFAWSTLSGLGGESFTPVFFFLLIRRLRRSTLFPYTTLIRS